MNKKKISIVAVSAVVIVSLGLGFNSIFKKANTLETDNNDTVVSDQSIETGDELNTEEAKVDKTETKKENKENKKNEDTTDSSGNSNENTSKSTKTDGTETKKPNNDEVEKTDNSSEKPKPSNNEKPKPGNSSEKPKPSNNEKPKPSNNEKPKPGNSSTKPKPENNQTITSPKPKNKTVTIAISCKTAINNGLNKKPGFSHLPSNGIILQNMKVEFSEGDTVFDILVKVTRKKGIHMEYRGSGSNTYIEGINNLYEFDGGSNSGWMYSVNGVYPNYGVGAYKVKSSDVIKFNYTCNLGADLGARAN
ncbi:protein of unknown function [Intestinibacter bartlettii DSM 16795]|uniref:DUF4430 domain-containing protein n=1 Tax=Intestinibacter bartlettii TaxID=261299 RepID=UPI00016318AF|nr:DUF4430 domain-containing protein [Intestinibacter bartlettii]EDQ97674.1 hypothetical protein CLOBAR_00415 [Intestinibacter bartlettii DSM 16795]UWO81623.1 DUF4430 domain-containing protein [Intestinibacter bartlettii]CUP01437.1 surface/cell-adhesion protein [Intestinibacter bartlettii]SKA55617.1 protein of unknown function [Intestinibacter bartlettii DSM 16795]